MNVIVFIADDMGWADVGYVQPNPAAKATRNITELARGGVVAHHYYTPSPICSPSRYAMMTGRNPAHDGIFSLLNSNPEGNLKENHVSGMPLDVPNLYRELKKLGYVNGHFGKWHMGIDRRAKSVTEYGVDEYWGWSFPYKSYTHPDLEETLAQGPDAHYGSLDDGVAIKVNGFIRRAAASGKRFFVNASFFAPHHPLHPKRRYLNALKNLGAKQNAKHREVFKPRDSVAQIYYAAIMQMDNAIGSVMATLRELGVEQETLVIFTADNGPGTTGQAKRSDNQWGRTGDRRGTKIAVGNGGLNVPFVVHGPGIPKAVQLQKATITGVDLLPTILSMVGGAVPPGVDGEDMSSAFRGEDRERTKPIFWLTANGLPGHAHIADRFPSLRGYFPEAGLSAYAQTDGSDFAIYDRNKDPSEMTNIVEKVERADTYRDRLLAWFRSLDRPILQPDSGQMSPFTGNPIVLV